MSQASPTYLHQLLIPNHSSAWKFNSRGSILFGCILPTTGVDTITNNSLHVFALLRAIILLPLWEQFHLDKVCKSQYCILNKSFSVQFWSCQSNLMERGRLLRALCSKYSVFGHQHSHSGERYVLILNQIGSLRKLYAKILCQHPTFQIYFLAFSYWHWYWRL